MTKYDTQGAFDKLGEDPFLPPAPAPRKSRKGWVIAGLVVGAILIGGAMSETENPTSASAGTEISVDAATLVDSLDPGLVGEFCTAYESIDPSMARVLWDQAYSEEFAGDPSVPSSSALWFEMTSRC